MSIDFQTGDIMLFHGTKSCLDKLLECVIPSKYSHTAMVIVLPNPAFPNTLLEDGVYILESTKSEKPDVEDHEMKLGVQMTRMEDALNEEGQVAYHRKINCERDAHFYRRLADAHNMVHNVPYDLNIVDWINAANLSWFHKMCCCSCCKRQREDRFWCSALVAYVLVQLGLLRKETPWTLISPRDLGTNHKSILNFINCTVEKEVLV